MGKLRERSGGPRWGATKKTANAYSKERAYKNQIHELTQQLERCEAERREQASTIAKLNEDARNWKHMYDRERVERVASVGEIFRKEQVDEKVTLARRELLADVLAVISGKVKAGGL